MTKYIDRYYLNGEMYAIKFPELVTVWSINNPQFVGSNTTSTTTTYRNNLEFSADGTFLYYGENTTSSGPTQITLSTPWDVTSSTTSVTNIPDMMYGSGWNGGGCPRFIPDGSICWSCYGYTVRKFTLNTPRDLTQGFSFVDYSFSEGIGRGRIFADEGRKIIAQGLRVYNLSTPYDISTTDRINYQENQSLNCGDCGIFISDDGLHLYVGGDFSGTHELRHYELSNPYDISSPTLLETALGGGESQIGGVYFHDDKMYTLCLNDTPEIKEWTVTTS